MNRRAFFRRMAAGAMACVLLEDVLVRGLESMALRPASGDEIAAIIHDAYREHVLKYLPYEAMMGALGDIPEPTSGKMVSAIDLRYQP